MLRISDLYHRALECAPEDRLAFLENACNGNQALLEEVNSLLRYESDAVPFLETPAAVMAGNLAPSADRRSMIGRQLGQYAISALLGAGGMGDVYRAHDSKLGRDVAIKILPPHLTADNERRSRLAREAHLLATLNHPHIGAIYGFEDIDGVAALVLELVEGATLAERLARGPLPIAEALAIARQVAEALEAAHEKGIVHRDLKPENIVLQGATSASGPLSSDTRAKVLDFGLGKMTGIRWDGDPLDLRADSGDGTANGRILGTPAYMSPEQARGQVVDRRTDIWAFGCCLYECLTGRSAFAGTTATDTLAAVLDKEPDWGALSDSVPHAVRRLLRRLLAKDVRHRLQHIGDARLELEDVASDASEPSAPVGRTRRAVPVLLAGAALLATVTGLSAWLAGWWPTAHPEIAAARLTLKIDGETAESLRLLVERFFTPFALSPDGMRLVIRAAGNGRSQLFVRELSGFETRPIPGTEGATTPFFSPDGHWVGFWRAEDRILRKVSLAGGSPIEIAQTDAPIVAIWTSNDEIVIETGDPTGELWSIPASGGTPKPIAIRDRSAGEMISLRAQLPGSQDLLIASFGVDGTWLQVLSRETGTRRQLLRGGSNVVARYTGTRHLVFSDGDALRAVPVNQRFEPVGEPTPVLHGIDHDDRHSNVALSDTGTVVYVSADQVKHAELLWLNRDGNATPVPGGRVPFETVALSPDGREVAGDVVDGTKTQVWIRDLARGAQRLLVSEGNSYQPIWSRDGRFITYWSTPGNTAVFRKRADGTGSAELLMGGRQRPLTLEDWSPDGRSLLFSEYTNRGDTDVWIYSDGKARPLLSSPSNEEHARFSPDGRYIAFDADDGGLSQVYVQPFPGPGSRTAISTEEGDRPVWIKGGQLVFLSAGQLMFVDVQTHPDLRVGRARPLNGRHDLRAGVMPSPGGQFLLLSPRAMGSPIELRIILNWFQELERLAPHPPR
jgi:serine/threonine protein kinase/Tol biopolymer transport system component